jgi:electron transport complex protein RnfB
MTSDDLLYRDLQQHLDRQAVGFPAARSGADLRLLKRLFTPDEARLALHLTDRPSPTEEIVARAGGCFPPDRVTALLESMFSKGAIGWKKKNGADRWSVLPLVIGMYEQQDGSPSHGFLQDADAYFRSPAFGRSFLSVKPSQMRTIPLARSIPVEHRVATYDQVRAIVDGSAGPFVVLPCICRKGKAMNGKPCARVDREETCLAFGDMAAGVLRRGHGREVTRREVVEILRRNEEDGLVLQPANTRQPEFICSCCGCCCGMLSLQKFLPRPVDFWTTDYRAEITPSACSRCGTCVERCQVNAVKLSGPSGEATIDRHRCIGCGLCVVTCPSGAVRLEHRESAPPPANDEELLDRIRENKKGPLAQMRVVVKAALRMKP